METHPRLHLDYLPWYEPALNPQERIWRRVRYEATTNRWFETLDAIWETIRTTTHSWSDYQDYERSVIVTSDGDFACLVRYLYEQEKLERVPAQIERATQCS